ncbi:MAG TPA: long-chain fatty acid--CoA ligase [Terriglobales bacterium]|nr:long-chain fatty acid--CoA ligase [Terriglobales bacterium]
MIAGDLLGERARLTPDKVALIVAATGERFTYAQLDDRAVRCARVWSQLSIQKGDRVGILAHNRLEFVDAFFAAGKLGAILVPLSTRLTAHELAYIVRDSGMVALMYDGDFAETVGKLRDSVDVRNWIALDAAQSPPDVPYPDELTRAKAEGFVATRCEPESVYCLLYTSGTTGKPKGVMIPHRMIVWNAYNTVMSWQLRDTDISPIFTPMYHAGGLNVFLTPLFAVGGSIIIHKGFDATEVWRTLAEEKCTVVMGVPTIYKLLMEAPEFTTTKLPNLRWLISGGAPLPHYIIENYSARGITFKQGYGLTEAGVNCFAMTPEDSVRKLGSIGRPMLFCEARLVDPEGQDVTANDVGELWLRGPHVCKGYWNQPEATASTIDSEGWLHTGDLARKDEEGFFYIAGRSKDMFISGGVNVYPAEIEAELLTHPDVKDAAVIGVPHAKWGEVGVAFVVAGKEGLKPEELVTYLSERLSKYKIPREFVFTNELPRSAYGKVVKPQLQEEWKTRRASAG